MGVGSARADRVRVRSDQTGATERAAPGRKFETAQHETDAAHQELPSLLACARAGDRDALDRLLTVVYPIVRRVTRARFGDLRDGPDLAEDASQEAALRVVLYVRGCQARTPAQVVAWVLVVAARVALDVLRDALSLRRLRARYAEDSLWQGAAAMPDDEMAFDTHTAGAATRPSPRELLLSLTIAVHARASDDLALLFWGRLIGGLSWTDLACALNTTAGGVKRRYQRAQKAHHGAVLREIARMDASEAASVLRLLDTTTGASSGGIAAR